MAQPTPYQRQTSFSNYQAANPSSPLQGSSVDAEFNSIKTTLDQVLANLELIQRDDGDLANQSVGYDQFASGVTVGFNAPVVWVTATAFSADTDTVFHGSAFYRCLANHTSGTFSTDLAAGKWELIVDLSALTIVAASQIAVTPTGSIAATTVQAALAELDSEKAALSHTHPASAISDSTAAGRSMLTAANAAAQQALLGLGDLAYLDNVPLNTVAAQLAFTGVISPAALAANTNNWSPTGLSTASIIRFSATSAIDLTGLLATAAGDMKVLHNVGSFDITLKNASASSSAANRFVSAGDVVLRAGQSILLFYDGTSSCWRIVHVSRPQSSQAQAEAGTDTTTDMTPQRVAQAITALNPFGNALFHLKATTTPTTTAGAWQTYPLSSITNEISGASIASNQITLPAGEYWVDGVFSSGFSTNDAHVRLRNITDSTTPMAGLTSFSGTAANYAGCALSVRGRMTIAAPKVFEVQVIFESSAGFGSNSSGETTYHGDLAIWKL